MLNKSIYFFIMLSIIFASCKKTQEVVISDNTAPPDYTINNEVIESYYNRVYITLIGVKPLPHEADSIKQILTNAQLSINARENLVSTLQARTEYYKRLYINAKTDLLNGLDTSYITHFIEVFNSYLTIPTYSNNIAQIQNSINKLIDLRNVPVDLPNQTITIETMYKRCVDNYFYDELNMGSENFVVSTFQKFLLRYPSLNELENAKLMVDGFSSNLFFQSGTTKNDYLSIFFNSKNFREGMARYLYKRYLFKEPTTTKLYDLTQYYTNVQSYQLLQKKILTSDEYTFY